MSTDRYEIAELLYRLAKVLDARTFDGLRAIYSEDAQAVSPRGNLHGIDEIVDVLSRTSRPDEQTLHVTSAVVVDLGGDRAEVSSNQLVYFFTDGEAPHRFSGGEATYTAARTPDGWRLTRAHIVPRWIHGTGTIAGLVAPGAGVAAGAAAPAGAAAGATAGATANSAPAVAAAGFAAPADPAA